jgi:hypothetical protein
MTASSARLRYPEGSSLRPRTLSLSLGSLLLLAVLSQGCLVHQGPRTSHLTPLLDRGGAFGEVEIRDGRDRRRFRGELIDVSSEGLHLLVPTSPFSPDGEQSLLFLEWRVVYRYKFEGISGMGAPAPRDLALLQSLSWSPPGLGETRIRELLEQLGQPAVITSSGGPPSSAESGITQMAPSPPAGHAHPGFGFPAADTAALLASVRHAAARFADPEEARLAGYRPLGPDFPGMGDHWIHGFRMVRGGEDPAHPPVLTYLRTPEGYRFTGVAFARILLPGEDPPQWPYPGAWHDHSGSVDEETLALNPHSGPHAGAGEPRLAMLHAWVGLENPDGVFAQDNWAVPFARLGLAAPARPTAAMGKALFLASGGDGYYLGLIEALVELPEDRRRALVEALGASAGAVRDWIEREKTGEVGAGPEWLEDQWRTLWREIRRSVGDGAWVLVQPLAADA